MPRERLGEIPNRDRVDEIASLYSTLQAYIKEQIAVDPLQAKRSELLRRQRKIKRATEQTTLKAAILMERGLRESYKIAHDRTLSSLNRLGATPDKKFNKDKHRIAIETAIELTDKNLLKAQKGIIQGTKIYFKVLLQSGNRVKAEIQEFDTDGYWGVLDAIIEDAVERHLARTAVSSMLFKQIQREIGEGNFLILNGRWIQPRKYAKMLARTRMRELQSTATKNMCGEYSIDLVQFSTHDSPCEVCAPLEGQIFSISGRSSDYPLLEEEPPIHPNCEHNLNPYSEVAARWEREHPEWAQMGGEQ